MALLVRANVGSFGVITAFHCVGWLLVTNLSLVQGEKDKSSEDPDDIFP